MRSAAVLCAIARFCGIAVALIVALPSPAYAHGEQLLVYPAATVTLLLLSVVGALTWRESRRLKTILVGILFGVHASLWFVPISVAKLADTTGRMFLALVAVPLGVVFLVYAFVRRSRKQR